MDTYPHSPPARPGQIDRLPAEILSTVFILYRDTIISYTISARWTKVMLVCRRWRDIIVNTAALWSYLSSFQLRTPVSVEVHIQRSRTAPLEVSISPSDPLISRILPWVVTQIPRIRSLEIVIHAHTPAGAQYQELLSNDFPMLTNLELRYNNNPDPDAPTFPTSPTAARFPNLTSIEIQRWELDSGLDVSRLRTLILHQCTLMSCAENSLSDFLDMLATCAALEQVALMSCFLPPELFADQEPTGRIVSLPLLTDLTLDGVLPENATSRLLAHIHVPHTAYLTLVGGDMDLTEIEEYSDLLPPDRETLPILTRCIQIQLNGSKCEGRSSDNGAIALRMTGGDSKWGLDACATIFASSPVVQLYIPADAPEDVPKDALMDAHLAALQAFPLLEILDIGARRATEETIVGVLGVVGEEGVCPRLRLLWLGWCEPSLEILDATARCVRLRHERGVRLARIELVLWHYMEPGCSHRSRQSDKSVGAETGDDGEGDGAGGAFSDGPEEETYETASEYDERASTGCPEEIEYWRSEFVTDLEPFVDEIVYEPVNRRNVDL